MVCRGRQEGEADKTRGRRGAEMGVWFRKNKKNIKKNDGICAPGEISVAFSGFQMCFFYDACLRFPDGSSKTHF